MIDYHYMQCEICVNWDNYSIIGKPIGKIFNERIDYTKNNKDKCLQFENEKCPNCGTNLVSAVDVFCPNKKCDC